MIIPDNLGGWRVMRARAAQRTEIRAVVTRADGRVEDLGVVSRWDRRWWVRAWWALCKRMGF